MLTSASETQTSVVKRESAASQGARLPRSLRDMLALEDFDRAARKHLPRMVYGFISGAVETGAAQRAAAAAYSDYAFVPRTFVDVSARKQSVTLFGRDYAVPFGIAPMGGSAIAAYRGDLILAEAAAVIGQPMIMSASSLIKLEEVHQQNPATWFQAYLPGDPSRIEPMVERVKRAGFEVLVVTGDTPVPGNRENNVRNGYSMPIRITPRVALDCILHPRWLVGTIGCTFARHGMPHFENMEADRGPPMFSRDLVRNFGSRDKLSWEHIALIRKKWQGPLVVKGLLSVEDTRRARNIGVDGVIVSSHGGRQLDHAVAPLRVLPRIKAEVPDLTIMVDGGIRRGTEVLKALALGAAAVFVGRPYIYAAAIAGVAGVTHASKLLKDEVDRDMALLGLTSLRDLSREHLTDAR